MGIDPAPPYVLVGRHDGIRFEYHVYCALRPGETLEFVAPDGDVVARWPDEHHPTTTDGLTSSGDRFFHDRDDLSVRRQSETAPGAGNRSPTPSARTADQIQLSTHLDAPGTRKVENRNKNSCSRG
jgi:hypothetical protein